MRAGSVRTVPQVSDRALKRERMDYTPIGQGAAAVTLRAETRPRIESELRTPQDASETGRTGSVGKRHGQPTGGTAGGRKRDTERERERETESSRMHLARWSRFERSVGFVPPKNRRRSNPSRKPRPSRMGEECSLHSTTPAGASGCRDRVTFELAAEAPVLRGPFGSDDG